MLIAFTGCWHSNYSAAVNAIDLCNKHGIKTLIQTGDFLFDRTEAALLIKKVEQYITKNNIDIRIIGIRGNHDNPEMYREFPITDATAPYGYISEHISYAPDGLVDTFDGVRIAFLGGAYSVDRAYRTVNVDYWEDEVVDLDKVYALNDETFDVFVSHEPPSQVSYTFNGGTRLPLWDTETPRQYALAIGDMLDKVKPKVTVTGHMHLFQKRRFSYADGTEFLSVTLDHGHYRHYEKSANENLGDFIYVMDTERM